MTSEFHWVDLKAGKETVIKKDSYSSDSLEDFCEETSSQDTDKSKTSLGENFEVDMSNDKSLSQSSSDFSSVHDNTSLTSHYSLEIVEETETLQTENITESIDIRILPENSSVMSFDCSNNFYSEFSLIANVEVQNTDSNENLEVVPVINESQENDIPNYEEQSEKNENLTEELLIDFNANDDIDENSKEEAENMKSRDTERDIKAPVEKFYATKIEITKQGKKISSSVENKIAEEIKEMKAREEDLRLMREKLAKEISEKPTNKVTILDADIPEKITPPPPAREDKPTPTKVGNAYITACVFAKNRKGSPVNKNCSSCATVKPESPVQREIRLVKEREEEMRREREEALKCKQNMESCQSELSTAETDGDSALSICSDSSFDSVSKLASPFPLTVSPEPNHGNCISVYSSSTGSICSLESLPQREKQNQPTNVSASSPSPDSAFGKARVLSDKKNKTIDMERFISSKGKEIKFKGDSGHTGGFYFEIKPPQVKKGEEMPCKRFVTAADKIRNELMEMKEREEQHKKERLNLNEIKDVNNSGAQPTSDISPKTKMDSPNPADNQADDSETTDKKLENSTRRRNVLIDEWEQRIQKSISQP